jgi:hypothetical protein
LAAATVARGGEHISDTVLGAVDTSTPTWQSIWTILSRSVAPPLPLIGTTPTAWSCLAARNGGCRFLHVAHNGARRFLHGAHACLVGVAPRARRRRCRRLLAWPWQDFRFHFTPLLGRVADRASQSNPALSLGACQGAGHAPSSFLLRVCVCIRKRDALLRNSFCFSRACAWGILRCSPISAGQTCLF